jgi:uncharacterized zinc-type alcohol dehydrogenase-like protein
MPATVASYAAVTATSPLAPLAIHRRDLGPRDVAIDIQYCGVCHSDLHTARGEWPGVVFPVVPGHEIVGRVSAVGSDVKGFNVGQTAAVGCMVDSCRKCPNCKDGLEQYCNSVPTFTYNSPDAKMPGHMTLGGYSKRIVVDQAFVLRMPAGLDLPAAAPLLCAGITTWSPLKHWGVGKGSKVGVVGLGGLGHMALKFSRALGAHTVLFTTSPGKTQDAMRLGADEVVVSRNEAEMAKHGLSFDFILNTVAAPHNLDAYTTLLKRDGTLCLVGAPSTPHPSPTIWPLLLKRLRIAGSAIGGIRETQEMLDFCAKHQIVSDIELIPISAINTAYERMLKSDVKYRFVIDMATL